MVRMARHYKNFVENHGYKMWIYKILRDRGYSLDIDWDNSRGEIRAYVYRDTWIAYCPTKTCSGAIIVGDQEPVMFCPDCHNADNDGLPYKVLFQDKEIIDGLLSKRKNPQTRNFLPGESVEDLMIEQEAHGEL